MQLTGSQYLSKQSWSSYSTSHHESAGHMDHHMIRSHERERWWGHIGSPDIINGSHDQKKYLGTLHRAPACMPTHYVYPLVLEALIPVCAILPSHPATSPTAQLRGESNAMDVNDKSPVLSCQGGEMGSAATPQAQPVPQDVLPRLDTRDITLQQPAMSHPTPPESDHLPFPMLTDDITSHEYALHWLADHLGYTMQGEGLESIQVPSVHPVSLNSPVSSIRHRHLDSGGGWTSNPPISPESIPIPPDAQSQEQGPCDSQVQETEASRECSQYYSLPPLSICTPPPVPTQYMPAAEASALDDTVIPGGYPW